MSAGAAKVGQSVITHYMRPKQRGGVGGNIEARRPQEMKLGLCVVLR